MSVENRNFAIKCREHWVRMKLSNSETLKTQIVNIFERHTHQ